MISQCVILHVPDTILHVIWSSECYSEVVAILRDFLTRACNLVYYIEGSDKVKETSLSDFGGVGGVKLKCVSFAYRNISKLH